MAFIATLAWSRQTPIPGLVLIDNKLQISNKRTMILCSGNLRMQPRKNPFCPLTATVGSLRGRSNTLVLAINLTSRCCEILPPGPQTNYFRLIGN